MTVIHETTSESNNGRSPSDKALLSSEYVHYVDPSEL